MGARLCAQAGAGCPARRFQISFGAEIFELGAEMDDSKGKIGEILWMERGGKLDPLETKQIHGSKSTKHRQTNKSQKMGLFFVGIFEIGQEHNKTRLENGGRDSKYVINVAHDTI